MLVCRGRGRQLLIQSKCMLKGPSCKPSVWRRTLRIHMLVIADLRLQCRQSRVVRGTTQGGCATTFNRKTPRVAEKPKSWLIVLSYHQSKLQLLSYLGSMRNNWSKHLWTSHWKEKLLKVTNLLICRRRNNAAVRCMTRVNLLAPGNGAKTKVAQGRESSVRASIHTLVRRVNAHLSLSVMVMWAHKAHLSYALRSSEWESKRSLAMMK